MVILKRCVYALAVLYVVLNLYCFIRIPNAGHGGSLTGSVLGSALLYLIAKKVAESYERHRGTVRGYLALILVPRKARRHRKRRSNERTTCCLPG